MDRDRDRYRYIDRDKDRKGIGDVDEDGEEYEQYFFEGMEFSILVNRYNVVTPFGREVKKDNFGCLLRRYLTGWG